MLPDRFRSRSHRSTGWSTAWTRLGRSGLPAVNRELGRRFSRSSLKKGLVIGTLIVMALGGARLP
jgi:hypothetical protein